MASSSAETTTTATEPLTHKALFEENIKKIKIIYGMSEVDHSPILHGSKLTKKVLAGRSTYFGLTCIDH